MQNIYYVHCSLRQGDLSTLKGSGRLSTPVKSCYQVPSLNETIAKKLTRKFPKKMIDYTRDHLVRTYPAGVRIDSSNFNPLMFWSFGIQMVALNYQTSDGAMVLNTAMFEQNGNCGYVLKPRVMWDESCPLYGQYNPWDFETKVTRNLQLIVTVVSGQFLSLSPSDGSPYVDVETIGIPCDCFKERTKTVQKNTLNPVWNQSFLFEIKFADLTFLRLSVVDALNGKCIGQRVIPLKQLRQGYRHVPLRNSYNRPLEISTLFIYSRMEHEDIIKLDTCETVHSDITRSSSQSEVINNHLALREIHPQNETVDEFVLVEDMSDSCLNSNQKQTAAKRVLSPDEFVLRAVSPRDQLKGRFIIQRKEENVKFLIFFYQSNFSSLESRKNDNQASKAWAEQIDGTFMVCIHNVSPNQAYTIIRVPVQSTTQDIIVQVSLVVQYGNINFSYCCFSSAQTPGNRCLLK
ncbi:unnamed protein product [Soboliphyme baturini]|uniref:Phosphoinositide phospholipase C n=1 Tax=Soboliphyme baturini TaxID=241478 RepID=A0A183IVF4_9BILA|nr:unnamed protein product [Soboliphyme baturini]